MTTKGLRVAVIGCGRIATSGHLPSLAEIAPTGLGRAVAVCDMDRDRGEQVARQFDLPFFSSLEETILRAEPDVVTLATLPPSHRALAVRALDAGCHVLCEKPIAMNLAEAVEMVAAAERNKRLLSVCFEYRYWDEAKYLRQRIARGDLGHVHFIRTWGGGVHELVGSSPRRHLATSGGGVLTHWTIHNLDLALWLLGHPDPLTASAFGYQRLARLPAAAVLSWLGDVGRYDPEIEDFASGFIRLANGTALTVEANFLQAPATRPEGWEILADRATAEISPIRVWLDRGDTWLDDTPPPGTLARCDYRMTRLIAGFLERVRDGGPPPVSGPEILRVQGLMDALYKSMAIGREVAIPGLVGQR
ncbi:MAG TPA: Gfo/Idh/MocA family oxidoreductase [Chloroflexota bacterium]|nr:Gfo/Idh/MocA family oxidoreductase [Chloroflexota bacterium]